MESASRSLPPNPGDETPHLPRQYSLGNNSFASVTKDLSRSHYEPNLEAGFKSSKHVVNQSQFNQLEQDERRQGQDNNHRLFNEKELNYVRHTVVREGAGPTPSSSESTGPPPPPGLHPRPPSSTSGISSASSSSHPPPSTDQSLDSRSMSPSHASSSLGSSAHPPFPPLSRTGSNYTLNAPISEDATPQYRTTSLGASGEIVGTGFFESALGYDDLLGPLPSSSNGTQSSSSSSNGTGRWNITKGSSFYSSESRSFGGTTDMRRRDTSPSVLQSIEDGGVPRNEGLPPGFRTREPGSDNLDGEEPRAYTTRSGSTASYFTGSGDSNKSSSLGPSASLFSPLSPLVEPFSPSTSLGAANWGLLSNSTKSPSATTQPALPSTSPLDLRSQSLPSLKQPQPAPPPFTTAPAFPPLSRRTSTTGLPHPSTLMTGLSSPPIFSPNGTSESIRKFPSSLTLSPTLVGVPENSEMMTRVPSALYGPNLALGGGAPQSSTSTSLFHQDHLLHQVPHQHRSREGTGGSDYGMVSSYPSAEFGEGGGGYGVGMSHSMSAGSMNSHGGGAVAAGLPMTTSGSRESFYFPPPPMPTSISSLSIGSNRREIQMDTRNVYPANTRQGYTEPSTRSGSVVGLPGGGGPLSGPSSVAGGGEGSDDISTIFVVGFPDDMLEREFQNMFLFADGFEAATLKHPSSSSVSMNRDSVSVTPTISATPPVATKTSAATSNSGSNDEQPKNESTGGGGLMSSDPYGDMLGNSFDATAFEDSFGNPTIDGSTSPLPGGNRDPAEGAVNPRKQIIGFAKFRTRTQALEARDILSGKRIDSEKGNVLKAEMAKKNLHMKREPATTIGSFSLQGFDAATLNRLANSTTSLSPAVLAELARQSVVASQQYQQEQQQPPQLLPSASTRSLSRGRDPRAQNNAAFEAFHSVPLSYPSNPLDRESNSRLPQEYYDEPHSPLPSSTAHFNLPRAEPRRGYSSQREPGSSLAPSDHPSDNSLPLPSTTSSPPHRHALLQSYSGGGNSMMQQLEEGAAIDIHRSLSNLSTTQGGFNDSESNYLRPSGSANNQYSTAPSYPMLGESQSRYSISEAALLQQERERERDQQDRRQFQQQPQQHSQLSASNSFSDRSGPNSNAISPRMTYPTLGNAPPPLGGNNASGGMALGPGSSFMGPLALTTNGIPRSQNPADMNAPKNTLYVGGLPAMLPNLAGAAHLEETLRNVFSRCEGFRRLCFRSKSNGPIVFVEFDNVIFATRALQDMYGNTLGGVVKGGIRLSYSKNPLGVRANHNNNHPPAPNASDGNFNSYGFAPPTNRRPSESVFGAGPPVDYQLRGSSNTSLPPPSNSSSSNSLYRSGATALPPPSSAIPFATTFSPFGNSNYDH